MVFQLDERLVFPNPELAEPDGLLAVGGDLSPERLMLAYSQGIFPWYSDQNPILWYSPHERFVLFPSELKVSKSMRKVINSGQFQITLDQDFSAVINACANSVREGQKGTWITAEMENAYLKLHRLGKARSIEVWEDKELVGGLYGIETNQVFCGESMFSYTSNASKAALMFLCGQKKHQLIDCQMHTGHLESLGARMISRNDFMKILGQKKSFPNDGKLFLTDKN